MALIVTACAGSFFRARSPRLELHIVTAKKELIARMESQMRISTLLLGAIGSIALIVGAIGIMDIMLVSVAERRRDIQSQFLIESVLLTVAGGLAATWTICRFTGWEFLISGISVASGIGAAAAVGLFFGFQPAYQAARLDPIAGLQGE